MVECYSTLYLRLYDEFISITIIRKYLAMHVCIQVLFFVNPIKDH